ncbi:MAG TPA: ATP-binding protein [Flavobacterium sp.]|nr:ATP-binding protein [Flavobacterium sp.]
MKWLLPIFFIPIILFGQKNTVKEVDSTEYYIQMANFNKKTNNYKFSLTYSQKAFDFANQKNDNNGKATALHSLGVTYYELRKYADAVDALSKSIELFAALPPSSEAALCYYELGMCYMNIQDFSKAESNFSKAKSIYDLLKIDASELLNLQKAILYKNKGKIELATHLFNQIIAKPDIKDVFKTKAEAYYQLGTIEEKSNRNNLALNYLNRAFELNKKDKNLEQKAKILASLSIVNEKLLDLKKSHQYLKAHLFLRDSLSQLNNEKLGADDYVAFKESERLKAIEQINRENIAQQKTNKFAKLISILAIALISILSLLSLSLYKNNIIRNQSNILLKEKNSELEIAKEKAEKASQARADFLSTVSHELRTPLNAINGITHLLLEEKPKETQLHYLNSLKFSGNYLLTFINEILEINRIESENIEIEYTDFNLKVLLFNIQSSLKELANINNNSFILDIDEKIPDVIIGDPTKMSQIFMNLINNALKFTKNGEVRVIAELFGINEGKATIHFEIIDNGIGIPFEKQQTIFDSFSQGSIEINRKYGGTGLGLTIVKKLIELLGGEIELNSEVNNGSTFSFDLNMEISQKEIEIEKVIEYHESILENKNVLIVEDNKINQMITKKMLENKGMKCKIIDNGEEAVEAIKNEHTFDLILMDVHLPGINGTIATQQIRAFNTSLPIIALTAISLNENREMLLSYGMTDVITKPFEPSKFYSVISQTLSISQSIL